MTQSNYFDGADYTPSEDYKRLNSQLKDIYKFMSDGEWRTVEKIVQGTNYPANSVQAQLRNLRKERFGAYLVERRRVTTSGLYEYRVGEKGASPKKKEEPCLESHPFLRLKHWNYCNDCGKKL